MRRNRSSIAPEAAEKQAILALAFIAEEPERLASFLTATGLEADAIRQAAQEPGFLAGVLGHILGDENLLIAFAQSAGIDPAEVARASAALGGGCERDLP
jgi:2-hydroxychromene-2-carboxylate isomerase